MGDVLFPVGFIIGIVAAIVIYTHFFEDLDD